MISGSKMAKELVEAFAVIRSTDDLIIYVAGRNNMLGFCQELMEQYDRDPRAPQVREIDALCSAKGILAGTLYAEIRKVLLALNRYHNAGGDHYSVLGLDPAASNEEVKKAYRRLSKQYHPDILAKEENGKLFMEIAGAYHAILAASNERTPLPHTHWRKEHQRTRSGSRHQEQKYFLITITILVSMLAGISFYISGLHDNEILLDQLQMSPVSSKDKPQTIAENHGILDKSPAPVKQLPPAEEAFFAGSPGSSSAQAALLPPSSTDQENLQSGNIEQSGQIHTDGKIASLQPAETSIGKDPAPAHANVEAIPGSDQKTVRQSGEFLTDGDQPSSSLRSPESQTHAAKERNDDLKAMIKPVEVKMSRPASSVSDHLQEPAKTSNAVIPENPSGYQHSLHDAGKAINHIISTYTSLYKKRELIPYLSLFVEDATENGHPLAGLTGRYRILFEQTRDISLNIFNIDWQEHAEEFEARGNFEASYTFDNGKITNHAGKITFHLVDDEGSLKIRALEYSFQE